MRAFNVLFLGKPLQPLLVGGLCFWITLPAAAGLDPEVLIALSHPDGLTEAFSDAEPCGLPGINPHVTGRCISVDSTIEEPPGTVCAFGPPQSELIGSLPEGRPPASFLTKTAPESCVENLALSVWTLARNPEPDGSERITVVPTARDFLFVPQVETSCGTWRLDMVIDPPILQPVSELILEREAPDSEHGSMAGTLSVGIRSRFTRTDGALVEIPGLVDLNLVGFWRRVPIDGGPWDERIELQAVEPGPTCRRVQREGESLILTGDCPEQSCPSEIPPCSPWCVVVPK